MRQSANIISKRRRAKEPYPTLTLGGQSLELVNSYMYLGVTVTSDLSWSLRIQQASVKARKVWHALQQFFKVCDK